MSRDSGNRIGWSASRRLDTLALRRPSLLLAAVAIGCSTADGLPQPHDTEPYEPPPPPASTGDSADSSGGDDDPMVQPEFGDNCGAGILGWQTTCNARTTKRAYSNPLEMTAVTVEDELGDDFANLCCEGFPSTEEADGGCQELCMQQLCEEARQAHMWWALEVAPSCLLMAGEDCGFDVVACLSGNPHLQILDDPNDLLDPLEYFLDIDCTAVNGSDRAVSGHWLWLEYPDNHPNNDEPTCFTPSEIGDDPDARPSQFRLSEGPGAQATFTWAFGEAHGVETTQDLEIAMDYLLTPCDGRQGLCLEISGLEASIPSMTVQGVVLGKPFLFLEESSSGPFDLIRGSFVVPDHALRFTLTATVNGTPLRLTGYNDGPVQGRVAAPTLTLNGLQFGYGDALLQATLRLDVSATADASKPSAAIRPLDAPGDCNEPVTFDASSTDPDGEALSHVWWHPPVGFSTGPTFAAVLAPGHHVVLLITRDAAGRTDATGIRYDRVCQ